MFEKITGNPRHFRETSAIETRRSADYFLPQGSDGQDSSTHRHAHQAEGKNMLNSFSDITITGITFKYC